MGRRYGFFMLSKTESPEFLFQQVFTSGLFKNTDSKYLSANSYETGDCCVV